MTYHTLKLNDGTKLAYHKEERKSPVILFLGGFFSDMTGTKATFLDQFCKEHDLSYVRFDYFGHGQSSGDFKEGTISRWFQDALEIFDKLIKDDVILIGSSMGGWIMLLLALARKQHIKGLIGIAPAPDFTEKLMWRNFPDDIKNELQTKGVFYAPSDYGEPYPITLNLIEDGRKNLLLDNKIDLDVPVRLIHGLKDQDVPYQISTLISEKLASDDVEVTFVKNGAHQLSDEADLKRLGQILLSLL